MKVTDKISSPIPFKGGVKYLLNSCGDIACTLMTAHHRAMNIIAPEGGRRRHLYGDKGATFSKGKETYIGNDGIANTVTTIHSKDNIIAEIMEQQVKKYRTRKLTPRECFRLMGCDDQTFDKVKASGISDSQLYKMAGNSIVVDVLCGIFTQMFRQDADTLF